MSSNKVEEQEFKRRYGVSIQIFNDMVTVVKAERMLKKTTGRKDKLSIEDQVLITLSYWREYRTFFHIGKDWGIHESTAFRIVRRVEDILIESRVFSLPGKKALIEKELSIDKIVIDVTEHEVERPEKKQKEYYSGKKKKHTIKTQIVMDLNTKLIICIAHGKGKEHDFKIFKESGLKLKEETECLADKGYQGINKIHKNSTIPIKKKKGKKLDKAQKIYNKELSSLRISIEHINREMKIFRILSSRYRNRRKRLGLRLNLLAGIYNYAQKIRLESSVFL